MIIWGRRVIYRTIARKAFFCPNDNSDQFGRIREARKWFTLFFIPIIPLDVVGKVVVCNNCRNTYEEGVLSLRTEPELTEVWSLALRHMIVSMLLANGAIQRPEKRVALEFIDGMSAFDYGESDLDLDLENLDTARHPLLQRQRAAAIAALADLVGIDGKEALLVNCLKIAAGDGEVSEPEIVQVMKIGRALGLSRAHVQGILAEVGAPEGR